MAGDWIKMSTVLHRSPKVLAISGKLNITPMHVVGLLHAFWSMADEHSTNGVLPHVSVEMIDHLLDHDGAARALESVGWLHVSDTGLRIPNFSRHNGKSAKKRALTARRQSQKYSRTQREESVRTASAREEKKRVEKKHEEKKHEEKTEENGATPRVAPGAPPASAMAMPEVLNTEAFRSSWERWLGHRKELRKPLTANGQRALLVRLGEWGAERAVAAIKHSMIHGWQGIYEEQRNGRGGSQGSNGIDQARARREARAAREFAEDDLLPTIIGGDRGHGHVHDRGGNPLGAAAGT